MKSKSPSISQTMTNSPGGVQAGRDVIINPVPTPRTLSEKQRLDFVRALKEFPPTEKVQLGCFIGSEEACAFAAQLLLAFREAQWPIEGDRVDFMSATERRAHGIVLFKRGKPLSDSPLWEVITTPTLAALRNAFSVINLDAPIGAHRTLEEGKIQIYVASQLSSKRAL